tara:strand:- start:19374 stop:21641 length:2268 start_codon:yes stop_codon:yes gene_type:complete
MFRKLAMALAAVMLVGCGAHVGGSSGIGAGILPDPVNPPALRSNSLPSALRTIRVESPTQFADAVTAAVPGDQIVLANGNWVDFDALLEAEGTAEAPVQLIAETPGKVILSGQSSLRLAGNYLFVSGLVFKDGYTPRSEVISFRKDTESTANNSRVTSTVIEGYSNPDRAQRDLWIGLYGKNNTFDFNHLSGKLNAGPTLAVRLDTEASRENHHRIANNYFGPRPIFGSNGGETLRIGTSHFSLTDSLTVVENNFFDRCSGEVEIISNKSGGNIIRGNTFYASRGTLTLRHGSGTLVENNLFDGAGAAYTGGVRVINARQTIRNNYFRNLTGNRFSGALVVMNGVPDSPINRYHQVDGAVIEHNTFDGVAAIELGEGSDAERSAVPINSVFKDNLVIGLGGTTPFNLYDDISGIKFEGNVFDVVPPAAIATGFQIEAAEQAEKSIASANGVGALGDFGVAKEATGVAWYPKASEESPFEGGRNIALQPGNDVLSGALNTARPGDRYTLSPGTYRESRIINVEVPLTVEAAKGRPVELLFERPNLFVLTGGGGLILQGVTVSGVDAPDGSGNSVITTSDSKGSGNHMLALRDVRFENLDVNRGFSVVAAKKGSFFDRIDVERSSFENVSGTVFKLDEEADDYGIYNAEFLSIRESRFANIGGPIAAIYRGGSDESTFGPHADISGSTFDSVGRGTAPLMVLYGVQKGSFIDNTVTGADPIELTFTTGLPVFSQSGNRVNGVAQSDFTNKTDLRNRK